MLWADIFGDIQLWKFCCQLIKTEINDIWMTFLNKTTNYVSLKTHKCGVFPIVSEGSRRKYIIYYLFFVIWVTWPFKKMRTINTVIKRLFTVRDLRIYRDGIRCRNRTQFHKKATSLFSPPYESSSVIISCQVFLCVRFNGFDYNGRIQWIDYIPAGRKIRWHRV